MPLLSSLGGCISLIRCIYWFIVAQSQLMSNSLRPHGLQHTRLPLSLTTSQSLPKFMSCQWCHPTISFSVVPFSSLPLIFPGIRVFSNELALPISGQSIRASASASGLPMNIPGWFPLGLTGLIFLLSQESSAAPQFQNINSLALSLLYGWTLTSIHDCWKNHSFD